MGPRLPGDKGPGSRPSEKKLTHNPFAALAAKMEEGGKAEAAPPEPPPEPTPAEPAVEAAPPAAPEAPATETPSGETTAT
jgi:3'-5' exoribonuclease